VFIRTGSHLGKIKTNKDVKKEKPIIQQMNYFRNNTSMYVLKYDKYEYIGAYLSIDSHLFVLQAT